MPRYPLVHRRALGFQARSVSHRALGQGGAAPQQNLIACINGPDLYDIYNPDMSLVERGVLNPNASYPGAQIDFAKFPPCPTPMATGAGGLCDVPPEYLRPQDPSGPPAKPVLACFVPDHGVTVLDYVTGAPVGTHLNAACLSLLAAEIAQEGDPRCAGALPAGQPPPQSLVTPTGTTPPGTGQAPVVTPPGSIVPQGGPIPTQPLQAAQGLPGGAPWPSFGSPIGVPAAGPGIVPAPAYNGGGIAAKPMTAPAFRPQAPMSCANNTTPKPLAEWIEECPGVKQARGY